MTEAAGAGGSAPYDLVTIGEAMAVLAPPPGERLVSAAALAVGTAGAEANVARTLAGWGRRVAWVGALGADPLGDRIVADLTSSGVDVSRVIRDPSAPTGLYLKDTDDARSSRMYYYRSTSAASRMDASVLAALPPSAVLHLTGITAAISEGGLQVIRAALRRPRRGLVSFDVNHRPALWQGRDAASTLAELADAADLVFVGLDEARALWGTETPTSIRRLLPGPATVVVKDGPIGATAHLVGDESVFEPAPVVEVVEPVGAGDAFAAGYLHALIGGRAVSERLAVGHAAAARALVTSADVGAPQTAQAAANRSVAVSSASRMPGSS